jgi:hypothetical protein
LIGSDFYLQGNQDLTGKHMSKRIFNGQVIEEFGNWAVTQYGLEFVPNASLPIDKGRLHEDWEAFIESKREEYQLGFSEALDFARQYFSTVVEAPEHDN